MNRYLGLIPARGGSKRLPNKNIIEINNKPLIYWSIAAAKQSKRLNDFVVSSESKEIRELAKSYGANVIRRPRKLSNDNVSMLDVLKHIANKKPTYDFIVLLQPTNPMRVNNLIDRCIEKLEEKGGDTLATGFMSKQYEWTADGHDPLGPLSEKKGWFYNDGCVEIHKRENLLGGRAYGDRILRYIVDEIHHEDIDTYWDLIKTEAVMKEWEKLNGFIF